MSKFDLVAVGACGIDILLDVHQLSSSLRYNKSSKELTIRAGDKVLLDGHKFANGQDAANVAVGSSRLGLKTAIFAEIGVDDFGERIIKGLEYEKVNVDNIKREKGETSFSVILDFQNERTVFTEHIKRDHDFAFKNMDSKFVYLTSLSRNWINAYLETMSFVTNKNIPFAFNPGAPQIEEKDKVVFDVIKKCKILFVNKEEAEALLNKKKSFTEINERGYIKKLLIEFKKLGASSVVITDAERGSYAIDERDKAYHLGALSTNVLEKTGAGDAYSAGFIYGFLRNEETEKNMIYGAINASSVIERIGAQDGLLSSDILEEKAKHLENFKAVII